MPGTNASRPEMGRRVCLFGGSFDPVHEGHCSIARRAVEACGLDRVVFLPCAQSPLKQTPPLLSDAERLMLLQLALADAPWAAIDELDLGMPRPSWTWRLVQAWKKLHPGQELFWLMGSDQWEELGNWGRPDYLARHLCFIVHHRGRAPEPKLGVRAVFIEGEHPASSSAIRSMLAEERTVPASWLHPAVARYLACRRGTG